METGKLENASLEIVCKQLVVNTRDQFCKNSGREDFWFRARDGFIDGGPRTNNENLSFVETLYEGNKSVLSPPPFRFYFTYLRKVKLL